MTFQAEMLTVTSYGGFGPVVSGLQLVGLFSHPSMIIVDTTKPNTYHVLTLVWAQVLFRGADFSELVIIFINICACQLFSYC